MEEIIRTAVGGAVAIKVLEAGGNIMKKKKKTLKIKKVKPIKPLKKIKY